MGEQSGDSLLPSGQESADEQRRRMEQGVTDAFAPQVGFAEDLSVVLSRIPRTVRPLLVVWIAGLVPGAFIVALDRSYQLPSRYAALVFGVASLAVWVALLGRLLPRPRDITPPVARFILGTLAWSGIAFICFVIWYFEFR